MTTIKKIGRQNVKIHVGDHNPPHVHIVGGPVSLMVILTPFEIIGIGRNEASEALKWVKTNREYLLAKWEEINAQ
ncbi:MAG: DUF4160 domain-containing protein [Magnetococcales bacterium]|nr:DUF4160 domain-containing protein [Magnetococcales bacterium]